MSDVVRDQPHRERVLTGLLIGGPADGDRTKAYDRQRLEFCDFNDPGHPTHHYIAERFVFEYEAGRSVEWRFFRYEPLRLVDAIHQLFNRYPPCP